MPAGTGVASPGWDGVVRCAHGNRFVPAGLSVWELSTKQNDSHGKADRDYDKRVEETPRAERTDIAYVAVACAPWTTARDFEKERSRSGDFRQVKALNVDSIEAWLECAPATTVWLREQMGEPVAGVGLLSDGGRSGLSRRRRLWARALCWRGVTGTQEHCATAVGRVAASSPSAALFTATRFSRS